jgi:hypothetical protein
MKAKIVLMEVESDGPLDLEQLLAAVTATPLPKAAIVAALPAPAESAPSPNGLHRLTSLASKPVNRTPAKSQPARPAPEEPDEPRRGRRSPEMLRDEIARLMIADGPQLAASLVAKLRASNTNVYKALKHNWFCKCEGGWTLTPGGRVAAEVVAAAP